MRLFLIILLLSILFALPLAIFGDRFDRALEGPAAVEWLKAYGLQWAWAVGVGLMVADLFLPVPSTAIMAALGILYGPIAGGLISTAGSMLAGGIAYGLARLIGRRGALILVGERDLARAQHFFARSGGYAVAFSRALPLLAEVIACLAGLAGMRTARFVLALACGALPMGMVFAWLGHVGGDRPVLSVVISAAAPLVLWPVARRLMAERPAAAPSAEPALVEASS